MSCLARLRLITNIYRMISIVLISVSVTTFVSSCATTREYNPTTSPNELKADVLAKGPIKNVVIANVNIGSPSRNYVERSEAMIDGRVAAYLKSNGYNVLPQREFAQRWENAKLIYGDPVDPTTGRVNTKTFIQMIQAVRDEMLERTQVDAIMFTDLIEHDVVVGGGMNHVARFHGVTRKPPLKGAGDGVSADFDWGAAVAAISIQISIYDKDLDQLFVGIGGIDLSDAIDTRTGSGWTRRKDVLENESFIDEGIQLALHPLIKMANWPGTPPK